MIGDIYLAGQIFCDDPFVQELVGCPLPSEEALGVFLGVVEDGLPGELQLRSSVEVEHPRHGLRRLPHERLELAPVLEVLEHVCENKTYLVSDFIRWALAGCTLDLQSRKMNHRVH